MNYSTYILEFISQRGIQGIAVRGCGRFRLPSNMLHESIIVQKESKSYRDISEHAPKGFLPPSSTS